MNLTHILNRIQNITFTRKFPLGPSQAALSSEVTKKKKKSDILNHKLTLPVQNLHAYEIIQRVLLFCVRIIAFSLMFLRFISIVFTSLLVCSFSLLSKIPFYEYTRVYPFPHEYLGFFPFMTIINKTYMNINIQVLLGFYFSRALTQERNR